jgi:hypothetical protein
MRAICQHVPRVVNGQGQCVECKRASGRRSYRKHFIRAMLYNARKRAEQHGLAFNITEADFIVPEFCPALGLKLECGGANRDAWPTLDRFLPALGYVRGNVCVISNKANKMKNDGTLEELAALVKWMRLVKSLDRQHLLAYNMSGQAFE